MSSVFTLAEAVFSRSPNSLSEKVADFGEELLIFRGPGGGRGRLFLLETVGLLHDDENHESDDEKVDDRVEEEAVVDRRDPGRLRRRERLGRLAGEIDEQAGEIDLSEDQADGRH